jgi:predicted RNase H-like HicB family nuclease
MSIGLIPGAVASLNAETRYEVFGNNTAFRCDVLLCPEAEGGFSAHCLNLRGVVSEGETEAEALANIADAFRETVAYYRGENRPIPWGKVSPEPTAESLNKYIIVRM